MARRLSLGIASLSWNLSNFTKSLAKFSQTFSASSVDVRVWVLPVDRCLLTIVCMSGLVEVYNDTVQSILDSQPCRLYGCWYFAARLLLMSGQMALLLVVLAHLRNIPGKPSNLLSFCISLNLLVNSSLGAAAQALSSLDPAQCVKEFCDTLISDHYENYQGVCPQDRTNLFAPLEVCLCDPQESWTKKFTVLKTNGDFYPGQLPSCANSAWISPVASNIGGSILLLPRLLAPEVFILLKVSGTLFCVFMIGGYFLVLGFSSYRCIANFRYVSFILNVYPGAKPPRPRVFWLLPK